MLQQLEKRIRHGLEPVSGKRDSVMTEIAQVTFAAYCLKRRFDIEGDLDDILVAITRIKGCKTTKYFTNFARNLYHWMGQNFADLPENRIKEAGNKQLEVKVREEIKRLEKERQMQLSLAKKKRAEFEREYNRTKRKQAAARKAKKARERRSRGERILKERFDRLHPYKVTHKVRLSPNRTQTAYLERCVETVHFCYNWALKHWNESRAIGINLFADDLLKQFNEVKYEKYPEVQEVTHFCCNTGFANFRKAMNKFFRSVQRGERVSVPVPKKDGDKLGSVFYVTNWLDRCLSDYNPDNLTKGETPPPPGKRQYLRFPDLGYIKMMERLRFDGRVCSITVKRETDDHWYACIRVNIDKKEWLSKHNPARLRKMPIGIDLGVKNFAALSNGIIIENPGFYKNNLHRIRVLDRKAMRKQHPHNDEEKARGVTCSKNYTKAMKRMGRYINKQWRKRNDFNHKLTSVIAYYCRNVAVETLNVEQLLRKRKASGYLADVMPYTFRKRLRQKMELLGTNLVEADRYFASTQICSTCGERNETKLGIEERTFVCHNCGSIIDRDLNAAINLSRLLGLGESEMKSVESSALMNILKKNGIKAHRIEAESG
jgi:putative transposase